MVYIYIYIHTHTHTHTHRYICFGEKGKLYYALHFIIKSLDLIQVERKFTHVLIKDMILFTL